MEARTLDMYVAEAFTLSENKIFTGNTAGVCILDSDDQISDEVKLLIARDMNLSETAFVAKRWVAGHEELPLGHWTLRWFTPTTEVALCGHATLASARVLLTHHAQGLPTAAPAISFHSRKRGILTATAGPSGQISLNFPTQPAQPISEVPDLDYQPWLTQLIKETLRVSSTSKILTPIDVQMSRQADGIVLLRVKTRAELDAIAPNFAALAELPTNGVVTGVVVTAEGQAEGPHFYSRFFCPWYGVDEDPVTGLTHTILAPYWNANFPHSPVPDIFRAVQLSARDGEMFCELIENNSRVKLSGTSRITLSGKFQF